jgi:hypothetical protein
MLTQAVERLVVSRMCQSSVYHPNLCSREHRIDGINLVSDVERCAGVQRK